MWGFGLVGPGADRLSSRLVSFAITSFTSRADDRTSFYTRRYELAGDGSGSYGIFTGLLHGCQRCDQRGTVVGQSHQDSSPLGQLSE